VAKAASNAHAVAFEELNAAGVLTFARVSRCHKCGVLTRFPAPVYAHAAKLGTLVRGGAGSNKDLSQGLVQPPKVGHRDGKQRHAVPQLVKRHVANARASYHFGHTIVQSLNLV
jgi:hypothetical protein